MERLPKDPIMLYSVINTKLRDFYSSLEALCEDMNIDKNTLKENYLLQALNTIKSEISLSNTLIS